MKMLHTRKNILSLLPLALAMTAAAQIRGPELGYTSYNGELRRIEGLSISSRLSEPLQVASAGCAQLDVAPYMRWAVCAGGVAGAGTRLLDLTNFTSSKLNDNDTFERVIWSPSAGSVAVDSNLYVREGGEWTRRDAPSGLAALSDDGAALVRRTAAGDVVLLSLDGGESIVAASSATSGDAPSAVAFDGVAVLLAYAGRIERIVPGQSAEQFEMPFGATELRAVDSTIYAISGNRLARLDTRSPGNTALVFEVPASASASSTQRISLLPLLEGSLLLSHPSPGEPGWLFRWREDRGNVTFIPGIPHVSTTPAVVEEKEIEQ